MKKLFLYVFLVLMFCNVGVADCIKGDCVSGQGTYTFAYGDKYVGEHKDGKFHGLGTITAEDGKKYVGEHKDGKKHGQGTLTWADGTVYKGIWKKDELVEPN